MQRKMGIKRGKKILRRPDNEATRARYAALLKARDEEVAKAEAHAAALRGPDAVCSRCGRKVADHAAQCPNAHAMLHAPKPAVVVHAPVVETPAAEAFAAE